MEPTNFAGSLHISPTGPQGRYAVIVSGDGLKTSLATALADKLADQGITTARVMAIKYFWTARSPEKMSKDLAAQLRRRLKKHPADRFILIGFSFGGGTLPFAVNRLPDELKARIDGVAILATPESADFKFFFRSWLNKSTKDARPTAPEIELLSVNIPVLYMRGETDFIGPSDVLKQSANLKIMTLPGGHDFNKDYDTLVELILQTFPETKDSAPALE